MKEIKITVIVPVYNTEKYLSKCLDSILSQTLKEIEIICIDDGSTDSSSKILAEYAIKDPRLLVIRKKNDGLGAARNTGIEVASGEYISFVDSDDFIDPQMLNLLYNMGKKTESDVVIGNVKLYFNDSGNTEYFRCQKDYDFLSLKNGFLPSEEPWIVENIGCWDRIYKRSFLEKYNLRNPEHVIYEDALFSFQTSILANKIAVVPKAVYYYRKNTGCAITDNEIKNDTYKFDFLKNGVQIKAFLIALGVYPIYRKNYLHYIIKNALWHQSNICKWGNFKTFYYEVRNLVPVQELFFILQTKGLNWKIKLYSQMLLLSCPAVPYILFFIKRCRIKYRQ